MFRGSVRCHETAIPSRLFFWTPQRRNCGSTFARPNPTFPSHEESKQQLGWNNRIDPDGSHPFALAVPLPRSQVLLALRRHLARSRLPLMLLIYVTIMQTEHP